MKVNKKKLLKVLPIIGTVVGVTLVISSLTLIILDKQNIQDTSFDDSISLPEMDDLNTNQPVVLDKEETEEEKEIVLRESGWIPNWGFDLGFESLQNNKDIIDTVNPVLYSVDGYGNVVSRGVSQSNIEMLLEYCKKNNIRVIPTVGSFDYSAMVSAFNSTESYQNHLNTILSEIDEYDFDGIDIDYEMIHVQQKEFYLNFLKDLKQELQSRDKILSISIFPQWENAEYVDNQETREVQDYITVGEYADEVRIMAYDYTLQSSQTPGPIAPTEWIKDVLDYATKKIPKEKIWLGIHLYGYQWSSDKTIAFTYTTAENSIIKNPNINHSFLTDIGEGYAEFGCEDGFLCKAYFQLPEGINIRRDIAKEYGIAGVSYWRLGGELDILK
ncbi:MAG: glycosyl hydrolase family 18 protein [Candidatus Dojkabacteria bacterium]|jgi:spore germination protein